MTTLELYRKHKKGEIGRDRFLYEVRRDNNLPWITNITSYDDAVKILKNKGIIRESVQTDPIVDSVNPYALKRAVHKLLDKEKVLTNDSYVEALNKAAKKLTTPQAVKQEMFANAESVAKADSKLQTQKVKKNNLKDKYNEMKKAKGQQAPKATAAPTKENKKTKKPKGVEVMKEKGVEGSEKIIKEISLYLKKKLTENSFYHDYHLGQKVDTQYGPAVITAIEGGTLTVKTENDKLYDVQMNHVKHFAEKKKEQSETVDVSAIGGHEGGMKLANKLIDAIEMYNALDPDQKQEEIDRLKTDISKELKAKFDELMAALHDKSNYPAQEEDNLDEARDINDPSLVASRARIDAFKNRPSDEEVEIAADRDPLLLQAIKDLKAEYLQFKIDDEQSSSAGGDASSQYYGGILQAIEDKIAELKQLRALDAKRTKQLAQLSDEEFENVLASREEIDAAISAEPELEEAGEKTAVIKFRGGPTTTVDYTNTGQLTTTKDNSDVESIVTGTGQRIK